LKKEEIYMDNNKVPWVLIEKDFLFLFKNIPV